MSGLSFRSNRLSSTSPDWSALSQRPAVPATAAVKASTPVKPPATVKASSVEPAPMEAAAIMKASTMEPAPVEPAVVMKDAPVTEAVIPEVMPEAEPETAEAVEPEAQVERIPAPGARIPVRPRPVRIVVPGAVDHDRARRHHRPQIAGRVTRVHDVGPRPVHVDVGHVVKRRARRDRADHERDARRHRPGAGGRGVHEPHAVLQRVVRGRVDPDHGHGGVHHVLQRGPL
jgi:hypothetical protein